MQNKLQYFCRMAEEASKQITGSYQGWTDFLKTVGRLYKYPYHEQVMIHAQRPDATACAEYEIWNKTMRRYVRSGSKGIALIDTGDNPKIRYVFDVSDTVGTENSRPVRLWQLRKEHISYVSKILAENYNVSGELGFPRQLEHIAAQLSDEYWLSHKADILNIIDDTYLSEYDDIGVQIQFLNAAIVSSVYALYTRCGIDPDEYFTHENFLNVFDFNTPAAALILGTAVSQITQQVLRRIEISVRNYERENEQNRANAEERTEEYGTDLHKERGLSGTQPDLERGRTEAPRQIRQNEEGLSSKTQTAALERDDISGNAVPASSGSGRSSEQQAGINAAAVSESGGSDRGTQTRRPAEMGGLDEHLQGAGGGSDTERIDLQLNEQEASNETAQLSFFLSEAEQIAFIKEAGSNETPSAFSMSVPDKAVDTVLRLSGNDKEGRMKIAAEFSKGKANVDNAEFLRKLFHGGSGIVIEKGRYSAWFTENGILIAPGDSARYSNGAKLISWNEAAKRADKLLNEGNFATNVEIAEAGNLERRNAAEALWYLKHDLSDEAKEKGYLSCLNEYEGGRFPDEVGRIAEALKQPENSQRIASSLGALYADYHYGEQKSLLRHFHFHKLNDMLVSLAEMPMPRKEYKSNFAEVPKVRQFITEDEIAAVLAIRSSGVTGGKRRIYSFFSKNHTLQEQITFLKSEYGTGGTYPAVYNLDEDHSAEGIRILKRDCPEVQLSWNNAAKRIVGLIQKDRFLSPKEKEQFDRFYIDNPQAEEISISDDDDEEDDEEDNEEYEADDEESKSDDEENKSDDAEKVRENTEKAAAAGQAVSEETKENGAKEEVKEKPQPEGHSHFFPKYNEIKAQRPDDIVLFQLGDFFEMFGEDAKKAAEILDLQLTTRDIPNVGRVPMCGIPGHTLGKSLEKLREQYNVTICALSDSRTEYNVYSMLSLAHKDDKAHNTAEYGADGYRVFRDAEHERQKGNVEKLLEKYKPIIANAISENKAYRNACANSDRENAVIEGSNAVRQAVLDSRDMQLIKAYSDIPDFRHRLHSEVVDETYPKLHDALSRPLTQGDIDSVLIKWNGNIESKRAVVRYMAEHSHDRGTAAWLAAEYSGNSGKNVLIVRAGSPEEMKLPWTNVQRRIARLIQEERFLTDEERENIGNAGSTISENPVEKEIADVNSEAKPILSQEITPEIAKAEAEAQGEFLFEGYHFEPVGVFGEDFDDNTVIRNTISHNELGMSAYDDARRPYTHADFYAAAGNTKADIFRCLETGKLYLPGENELFEYIGAFEPYRERTSEIAREAPAVDTAPEVTDKASDKLTDLQRKATEIAEKYENLSMQDKITVIARSFGCSSGHIETSPCRGKWRGTSDISIRLDNGLLLFLGNAATQQAKTIKAQHNLVRDALTRYNPEIIALSKATAFKALRKREAKDNEIAKQRGLKPYTLLNIEFNDGTDAGSSGYMGWYYVTLAVDGKIRAHLETGLHYGIASGTTADVPSKADYYPAGGLDESDVDYVFNGVGFSSSSEMYSLKAGEAVIERAKAALADRNDEKQSVSPTAREEPISEAAPSQPVTRTEQITFFPADKNNLPFDIVIERLSFDKPEPERDEPEKETESLTVSPAEQIVPENFRITDEHLGEGGAKAKFRMNMDAINLLKELEFDGRQATPEQQEILSRYVGWGGLADAFDETKDNWKNEFAELYTVLSPEEYTAARASTLNAHYTTPTVIRAIYSAIENMGFHGGNILEPSCGVGNFFGLLPESMAGSRLYGVELDSVTGRIAKQLYPKANITVAGFETTDRHDFYDLAVGNVPFGRYQVNDRAYNKLNFNIHNYFFAKALDQIRPGGVIAFVTSRYTMDAKDSTVRRYLAKRAEFLGAIRLPCDAFKKNAGTEVTTDIIFLQKRDRPIEIEPDWVHLGLTEDNLPVNSYFVQHDEMVLGTLQHDDRMYGDRNDIICVPFPNSDLADQLREAIQHIGGIYKEAELTDIGEGEADTSIPADPDVRNYSYTVKDGEVYFRQDSRMVRPALNATARERVKGMVKLRDCVKKLIAQQLDWFVSDIEIQNDTQAELNRLYDDFTRKFGFINSRANSLAFSDDNSYFLLCSLEKTDDENNFAGKADIFTKRTIRPHKVVTSVDTASEALALSISEKACVDMEYMSALTGKTEEELASDLRGVIYMDFSRKTDGSYTWRTSDDFLSGNVREKLRYYENELELLDKYASENADKLKHRSEIEDNITALRQVQPRDLDASEIDVRLGATWVDPSYIRQFMFETFDTPRIQRDYFDVNYADFTAEWDIKGKNAVRYNDVNAHYTYGTERMSAYRILEDTLNLRDVRVYDTVTDADGIERRVLNSKETTLAQQKQQAIKDAFRDWVWTEPERRQTLVQKYNTLFNSERPREYDGSFLKFPGANPEIQLREHQLNAIARILYGGNTLLAHEVGAGKTFEMIAAAMESKRLGLCHKSLFAVPNHLTEQWASEFLRLYPSANILVATKKDFEPRSRKKFCARIATGDYDAVIIGHSQFERVPVSRERQEKLLYEQINEVEEGIEELGRQNAEHFTIKSLERTKRGLEARLRKLQESPRRDDVVTFEELGVDRLFVDEAHNYKNLFLYTKMRNVAGLSTTDAQKSSDMLLKCRYIDEITEGRGIVFATGTPVSNSMTELYTMMRYLQHETLQQKGLAHFDCWASTFGETTTAIELAPEGTGYRARTRFAKFFNLPELMTLFKEAADVKTSDQLNLPAPKAVYHNIVAQPTEIQKSMVQELSERASKVHSGTVDPSVDNMLKITSDGRKLGLDQRIINPDLPDEPGSKVNLCVDNILNIYNEGNEKRLTQLVFCDLSTPKSKAAVSRKAAKATAGNLDNPEIRALETLAEKDGAAEGTGTEPVFTVYDDIREKLVKAGIPRKQIAFIHEANTEARKKELFAKVRSGQVRVLMGSTFKMGAGMNVQDRLIALHDLDCPWRPGDLEQRKGRIARQGNKNPEVHIYRYVTEGTFDAYLWQTIENKQKFISQIMTSKSPVRACDDVDEAALSYAEIKALCAGDERIREKMDLDIDVARLRLIQANHRSQQYRLEDDVLRNFPNEIKDCKSYIAGLEADIKTVSEHKHPKNGYAGMTVKSDFLIDKDNAGAALLEALKDVKNMESVPIGSYRGFRMSLTLENFGSDYILTLKGKMTHKVKLGKDARGNLIRIDNALNAIPERLQNVRLRLDNLYEQLEKAKSELGKPFPQEEELREKSARLAKLNAELNIDKRTPIERSADDNTTEEEPMSAVEPVCAKSKPSVLGKLKAFSEQTARQNENKAKNYEEVL